MSTTAVARMESQVPVPSPPSMERTPRSDGEPADSMVPVPSKQSSGFLPELRSSVTVDMTKPLPTSLQSDFLPEDILFALTQPPVAKDRLGPPPRHRNLATSSVHSRPPPANLWSFKRRDKFKHLTDNTTCICGAGRDISFLYDVPQMDVTIDRPEKIDYSVIRRDAEDKPKQVLQLPDTLIPEEYHIVKNKGVMGIEYHEDKYTNQPEDHVKHLTVFPSMKPASRYEVVQLKKTLDSMLDRSGVNDTDLDIKGPTQMHNLLELIKKEQNIYNIIFHELIRQVSVECIERGDLLATLRGKYSDLLNKVPQQIKSLHEEVMAQRALDRRLTEELMRFKTTISVLTNELSDVKEHDLKVTREAQKAQEDLKTALTEAQKNASLLAEYHDLYELQRKRLERQVFMLSDEREIWSTAAYSLALKVTEECKLITAKRIHVSEKAWVKLANHFTILLSDKDTELLTKIQCHVEQWRDMIEDFNIAVKQREEEMRDRLKGIKAGVEKWLTDMYKNCFNKEGQMVKTPDNNKMKMLLNDIRSWEEILSAEGEVFGGDFLLSNQEDLMNIRKEMDGWSDNALKVFSRHRGLDVRTHPDQDKMQTLNEDVDELLKQYHNRITGENGIATSVIHLSNAIENWETKLTSALNGTITLQDTEWGSFYHTMDEWVASIDQTLEYVGTTQREEDRLEARPHTSVDIHETVRKTQKWSTTASNSIDSEDAKLVEQVSSLHSEMVQWMVQVLLRLAPDKEGNSIEANEMVLLGSASIPLLHENAKSLFDRLEKFSNCVTLCCDGIVLENTQKRQDNMEDNAGHELRDLQKLREECEDWIHTAQILMSQLTGESVHELFPATVGMESHQKPRAGSGAESTADRMKGKDEQPSEETTANDKNQGETIQAVTVIEPTADQAVDQLDATDIELGSEPEVTTASLEETDQTAVQIPVTIAVDEPQKEVFEGEKLEVIGGDDNTHIHSLDSDTQKPPADTVVHKAGAPDTKKAFEALATVDNLHLQLLSTEERAQKAEVRAAAAESELASCQEKLRALEKRLTSLTPEKDDGKSLSGQSSSSPAPSARTITPTPVKRETTKDEKKQSATQHSTAQKSSKSGRSKKK